MNVPRLCALRVVPLTLLAGIIGLVPLSACGQFATLLDTTSRYAGNSTGSSVFNGDTGVATATSLNVPSYAVFDSLGNLYISDKLDNCVRKVDTSGNITTVAGLRVNGGPDTCDTSSNPGPDADQGLLAPTGLAIDSSNTLYIADSLHNCVRSLASGAVDSYAHPALTTVAGTCTFVNTSSVTPVPDGLAVDSNSNLYISIVDTLSGGSVYQVVRHRLGDPASNVCAVAGEPSPLAAATLCPGITATVKLLRPAGLAFDKNGNLFIADSDDDCVREIVGMTTPQTVVGQCLNDLSGTSSTALFNPYGLAFSADASLYISEAEANPAHNNVVSYNSGTNSLAPIAGLPDGDSGPYNVSQDGQPALLVPLDEPLGVTTDSGGSIYIADSQNNVVRRMSTDLNFPNTVVGQTSPTQTILFSINQPVNLSVTAGPDYRIVSTTCSGPMTAAAAGQPPNTCVVVVSFTPTLPGFRYSPLKLKDSVSGGLISVTLQGVGVGPLSLLVPGVASTRASALHSAIAVSTDSAGDTYVLEQGNGAGTADVLFYPAGGGAAQTVVAQGAGLVSPTAMAVDGAGNIFVADSGVSAGIGGGNIIRFGADGSVNTSYATGLPGVNAMAVDGSDDLFLAIGGSFHNITEIYQGGTRSVVAGDGSTSDANGVPAVNAAFADPSAVALGPNGTISIADAGTHYVYTIDNSGVIHIVAGNGTTSTSSVGVATGTGLLTPDGLAVDAAGDIYIADNAANVVYAVYSTISNGTDIAPVIGTGTAGYTGDNGPSNAATINAPLDIALDGSSDLFVIDSGNSALREVSYPVTDTIGFGPVRVGDTSSPVLQYLANTGNASLVFNPYPFTTTDSHYAVSTGTTTCTGTTVSGGVCDIGYTFTPTAAGPAPAGQSNLLSNSPTSQQTVLFNTSGGSTGFNTVPLPFSLSSQTEVYGNSFLEPLTINVNYPASGTMLFSVGGQTLCTLTISNALSGTYTCNAASSGLPVGTYTVNFTFTSTNTFYSSVNGTTTLQVVQAPLTVTPNNFTRQYGQANPAFNGTVAGALNGDVFNATYTTTATTASPVGTYPITATLTPVGAASLSNYTVTYNTGTLTIVPAGTGGVGNGLTVTVDSTSRNYGQPNPTFTSTITGAANGDTFTVNYATTATAASGVGPYPVTATVTGAAAANYVITVVPGTLNILPIGTGGGSGLTVTVNSATRPYGTANPTFTGTVAGLINGDTVTVTYSSTATIGSAVGTYPITATVSGPNAANYVVNVIPGTLTITKATTPLVVTANDATRAYGAANPAFTGTVTGGVNGDTFSVTYSTTATTASAPGNYPITPTVTGQNVGNYNVTVVPGTLHVTPTAPLSITVNSISRPYGTANPTFSGTVTGAVNGDTFTVTYSTTATQFSPVGGYPITATVTGPNIADYAVTVVPGTLTVTPATVPLTVSVNSATRPYGTVNPTFTGTVTGALNGDTFTVTYSTVATQFSPVGPYPITATLTPVGAASLSNYTVIYNPGTLTVTPATVPLTVTVNNATRSYGTANPAFTSTVTGALNGDTFTVAYSTPATIGSAVGNYPITATVSGPNAADYTVNVVPGTLTITPATTPLVVTVNNTSRPYGAANPAFTSAIAGALNGDSFTVTYATTATIASDTGNYPVTATVTGANIGNYTTVTVVPGVLAVVPSATATTVTTSASPVGQGTNITFSATVTYGAGLPVPASTVDFYNGTTLLGPGTLNAAGVATYSTSTLAPGSYTITATYQATADFATSSGTVPQVVNAGTFTLSATPPNQFIRGKGSVVYAVTVSSVKGFEGPVALACSGLPADSTCTFGSPVVTLTAGGNAVTTMTVVTTDADARLSLPAMPSPAGNTPGGFSTATFAAVFPFGLLALFAGSWRKKRRRGARGSLSPKIRLMLMLLCTAGIVGLAGCACITSTYQVYTIPITGTSTVSGTSTQTTSVTLTVGQQ